mgnify:CR=1 FL=1
MKKHVLPSEGSRKRVSFEKNREYIEKLSKMINCKTVFSVGGENDGEFQRFYSLLPELFPNLEKRAERMTFGGGCFVYVIKGKNAKKFRHNVEYGSARWGNAKDIEPYMDPVFEKNIPLTQTESLMMSSRPSSPKYARNKNILVIGGSGSGKTRFFVKPSLMQLHSSYVTTDPNG